MAYRIRCGDRYYCGMAYKDGQAFQKWEKDDCLHVPLEMNLNDAECTLATLLEAESFPEMPIIEEVEMGNACFECTFYDMWEGICVSAASDRRGESVVGLGACEMFEEEKEVE